MKILKYLAIVLVALAVIAAVIQYKRESIARGIANSALREQGLVATDLSIETLTPEHIVLSHLVLSQDNGSRYIIKNISFPLSFPSFRAEQIAIEEIIVIASPAADTALPLSRLLQTFLNLPQTVPNTSVTLSRLALPDVPPIQNLAWQSEENRESLSFGIADVAVNVDVEPLDNERHRTLLRAGVGGNAEALELPLVISRQESAFTVEGTVKADLSAWLPVLQSARIVPDDLVELNVLLDGPLSAVIDDVAERPLLLDGRFSMGGARAATYRMSGDSSIQLAATGAEPVEVQLEYPSLDWSAAIRQSQVTISTGFIANVPGTIGNISCHSGMQCSMHVTAANVPLQFGSASIASVSFSSTLAIAIGEKSRIEFSPDTSLTLGGVVYGEMLAKSIVASDAVGARVNVDEDGWSADMQKLRVHLDALSYGDGIRATVPLSFSAMHAGESGSVANLAFTLLPNAATLNWNDVSIVAPGATGTVTFGKDTVAASVDFSDGRDGLAARVTTSYKLSSGAGSLALRDAALRFDQRKLSGWLKKWTRPWDIVAGKLNSSADIAWNRAADGLQASGVANLQVDSLAGFYNKNAFTGLQARLSANIAAGNQIELAPATVSVALLDVGIPLQELSADFAVDLAGRQLDVRKLSVSALGGSIVADPFRYGLLEPRNTIMLRPQSIQLQFMVDLAEFEDIELSGSISGHIPVTISDKTITVTDGRLESDPPGGVIRYGAGAAAGAAVAANSEIGLVSRALGNFQFDSLTSDVDYTEAGNLKLKMRLSGINPDMDPRQPVILNLGVENNIPQLLRSLQATRAIEDVLQKRKPQ